MNEVVIGAVKEVHAYIEVLSYDKIRNDSEKRNKALFDKLGIHEGNNMEVNQNEG